MENAQVGGCARDDRPRVIVEFAGMLSRIGRAAQRNRGLMSMRWYTFLLLLLLTLVGSTCTLRIGSYEDTGGDAPQKTSVLPAPDDGTTDEPPLNEAQQARLEEAEWYIATIITYNGEWLGYYPASLFTMLNGGACGAAWYGEVLDSKPGSTAIKTEMGSGKFVEAGLYNAAYVRNPTYLDLAWNPMEPEDWAMNPYAPLCYDRSILWEHYIYLGGPGGKNPACQWP
jgi:hypothetical protein